MRLWSGGSRRGSNVTSLCLGKNARVAWATKATYFHSFFTNLNFEGHNRNWLGRQSLQYNGCPTGHYQIGHSDQDYKAKNARTLTDSHQM